MIVYMSMLSITKTFEFSAGHRLYRPDWDEKRNCEVYGSCTNIHGHNYKLEVEVAGELDSETMMVLDTKKIKQIVHELVISELDHRFLNDDVPWLKGKIPTTEVLVSAFWNRIVGEIERLGVKLKRVRLWESRTICATREC